MNPKATALDISTATGTSSNIGCARSADLLFRTVVRTRSAPTASAMLVAGSLGP